MDNSITIRSVEPRDFSEWERMRGKLWPTESGEHQREVARYFSDKKSNPSEVMIAWMTNGEAIGFIELSIRNCADGCYTNRIAYIEGLFVEASVRRKGIAGMLVNAAEQWGRDQGCAEMASDTEIENEVSIETHKSLGFSEMSRLVCFRKDLSEYRP